MLRLMHRANLDRYNRAGIFCADDYWMYFRACKTPRDEILEGIRYAERRYYEIGEAKEDDWHFMQDAFRADAMDGYDYLLRFDARDIAERMEALGKKIDAIEWQAGPLTITQMMLQRIYRQRIQSLKRQLEVTVIRWAKHQTIEWRPAISEILQHYALNGLLATMAANHLIDLRRSDKELEIAHVTRY